MIRSRTARWSKINSRLKNIRFAATSGPHRSASTFLRRTFAESDDQLADVLAGRRPGSAVPVVARSRSAARTARTASARRRAATRSSPATRARATTRSSAPSRSSRGSRRRRYRRPLAETDLADLLEYYRDGVAQGGFEEGIRSAITGILASPYFLYRVEQVARERAPGQTYAIDDLELASRLSFFLWSTLPDDELLEVATRGELHKDDVLRRASDAHAQGSARRVAREQLRVPVAQHAPARRGRSGLARSSRTRRAAAIRAATT